MVQQTRRCSLAGYACAVESRGTIFVNATAGRALRKAPGDVHGRDVIDCAGAFGPGDPVYVVVRGRDGGQLVLARAIAHARPGADRDALVVAASAMTLIWER